MVVVVLLLLLLLERLMHVLGERAQGHRARQDLQG